MAESVDLKALVGSLSSGGRRSLESAAGLALKHACQEVTVLHWLVALLEEDQSVVGWLASHKVDPATILARIRNELAWATRGTRAPTLSADLVLLLQAAVANNASPVSTLGVIRAIILTEKIYQSVLPFTPEFRPLPVPDAPPGEAGPAMSPAESEAALGGRSLTWMAGRLAKDARKALEDAAGMVLQRTQYVVCLPHLVVEMLRQDGPMNRWLEARDLDIDSLLRNARESIDRFPIGSQRSPGLSPEIVLLLRDATIDQRPEVTCLRLLRTMLMTPQCRDKVLEFSAELARVDPPHDESVEVHRRPPSNN